MSKFGFNEKELRKTIVTRIDKDGFSKREIISANNIQPILFGSYRVITLGGSLGYIYEYGMSRELRKNEDYFICDLDEVDEKYGSKRLEYIPDVPRITINPEPVFSKTRMSTSADIEYPIYFQVHGENQYGFSNYIFIYEKDSGKIVGSTYGPSQKLERIRSTPNMYLNDEDGGILMETNSPLLMGERVVLVPTDNNYLDPYLKSGDKLPANYIEVGSMNIDRSHVNGRYLHYEFFPIENHGLVKQQRVWMAIVNSDNIVVDCGKSRVSNV